MSWQGLEGHDWLVERFRRGLMRGRLASTFLLVGPAGIGKRSFAVGLAKALFCESREETELDPCDRCASCTQVRAGTHPDLIVISKPGDRSYIPVDLLIGDREHRMREGLCHQIGLKPFMGGRKVAIIDDADYLNVEGANCLLKTLEEPPPRSLLILIGTSAERQLPTIRSRSQIIRFRPLSPETVAALLLSRGVVNDSEEAHHLALLSDGSLQRAVELADPQLREFRDTLIGQLAHQPLESVRLAKAVSAFVDEAGKVPAARRDRLRQAFGFAAQFYRQLLRSLEGAEWTGDEKLSRAIEQAHLNWTGDQLAAIACLERTLEALGHVDRNANQQTLIECWLDDLAQTYAGELTVA